MAIPINAIGPQKAVIVPASRLVLRIIINLILGKQYYLEGEIESFKLFGKFSFFQSNIFTEAPSTFLGSYWI